MHPQTHRPASCGYYNTESRAAAFSVAAETFKQLAFYDVKETTSHRLSPA